MFEQFKKVTESSMREAYFLLCSRDRWVTMNGTGYHASIPQKITQHAMTRSYALCFGLPLAYRYFHQGMNGSWDLLSQNMWEHSLITLFTAGLTSIFSLGIHLIANAMRNFDNSRCIDTTGRNLERKILPEYVSRTADVHGTFICMSVIASIAAATIPSPEATSYLIAHSTTCMLESFSHWYRARSLMNGDFALCEPPAQPQKQPIAYGIGQPAVR